MNESSSPPPQRLQSLLELARHILLKMRLRGASAPSRNERSDLQHNESRRRGFEITDVSTVQITWLSLGLVIVVALSMLVLKAAYNQRLKTQTNATGEGYQGGATQRSPIEQSWSALDIETTTHLGSYRWIDKQKGVVQIPIERAMVLIQEKEVKP